MRSSHLHLVIFLISAFIIIPQDSKSQTRKLRLAAENLREDKTEEALQNILKYEEKEGEQAPGLYLRYLYSLKTAKGTEGIETAYTMLNKAYTRLESADSKDADEWCSEIGFCISGKATDLNTVELMLFKAYTSDLDLSRINSFIMKYPGLRLTVRATDIRDSIEFSRILTSEDDKDFIAFLEARPNSKWSASARIKLHSIAFSKAEKDGSIPALEEFIEKYPKSDEYGKARSLLAAAHWSSIKDTYSRKVYIDYAKRFSDFEFSAIAKKNVEEQDWIVLQNNPSVDGYRNYIADHPASSRSDIARRELRALEFAAVPYLRANGRSSLYFINKDSVSAIQYDDLQFSRCGCFIARESGKFGVINESGDRILPSVYEEIREEQCYLIVKSSGLYGVFDLSGKKIIDPSYAQVSVLSDSLFKIGIESYGTTSYGVYKRGSGIIIPVSYSTVAQFGSNLFIVSKQTFNEYMIVDKDNRPLSPTYESLSVLDQNCAMMNQSKKCGVLTSEMKIIVQPLYDYIYKDTTAFRVTSNRKSGLLDLSGNVVLKAQYNEITPLSADLYSIDVSAKEEPSYRIYSMRKQGFVDNNTYKYVAGMSDGLIPVEWNGQLNFLNNEGALVIQTTIPSTLYEDAMSEFHGDHPYMAPYDMQCNNDQGSTPNTIYIDPGMYSTTSFMYGEVYSTSGRITINSENGAGYLDCHGNTAIPLTYQSVTPFTLGFASVYDTFGKPAVIDTNGRSVLKDFSIHSVAKDGRTIIVRNNENDYGIFDVANNRILFRLSEIFPDIEGLEYIEFHKYGYRAQYRDKTHYIAANGKLLAEKGIKYVGFDRKRALDNAYEDYTIGNYNSAISSYLNIEQQFGANCQTAYLLAESYIAAGDYKNAMKHIDRFILTEGDDQMLLRTMLDRQMANQEWAPVIETASRIIAMEGSEAFNIYANRAYASLKLGRLDDAIMDYTVVLNNTQDSYAFANRAAAYFTKGFYQKALADLNACQKSISSTTPVELKQFVYALRGKTFMQLNRKAEACVDWKTGARLGSDECSSLLRYCK